MINYRYLILDWQVYRSRFHFETLTDLNWIEHNIMSLNLFAMSTQQEDLLLSATT